MKAKSLFLTFLKHHLPVLLPTAISSIAIVSQLFGPHFFRNLEPYPDGLMYVIPPLELLKSGQWVLDNQGTQLLPNVPQLYSWLLIPILLFWKKPDAYILLNLLLHIGTVIFLYITLKSHLKDKVLVAGTLLLYCSNASILWYASLPMAEHVGVFLVSVVLFSILSNHLIRYRVLALCSVALLLTKYIYYPVSVVIGAWSIYSLLRKRKWKEITVVACIYAVGVVITLLAQYQIKSGPLLGLVGLIPSTEPDSHSTSKDILFFSSAFIPTNIQFYAASLLGKNVSLLWISTAATSLVVSMTAFLGLLRLLKKNWFIAIGVFAILVSQYTLLLQFYVQDLRYGLPSVVVITVLCGIGLGKIGQLHNTKVYTWLVLAIVLSSQLLTQQHLLKDVVSANIFSKTQSWQHQAILFFDQQKELGSSSYLITALPPFLITSYSNPGYQILPLSTHQEFIAKGQRAWTVPSAGDTQLLPLYQTWVSEGKHVYISNAYITHQHTVIEDYEEYKQYFNFELVATGCNNTCNLYKLSAKTDVTAE